VATPSARATDTAGSAVRVHRERAALRIDQKQLLPLAPRNTHLQQRVLAGFDRHPHMDGVSGLAGMAIIAIAAVAAVGAKPLMPALPEKCAAKATS